jgi:hypothetical protein
MYNINTLSFDMLPSSYYSKPSVYVLSDSQWNEYKREQSLAEITELNKLIAGHQKAIDRLKETRTLMEQQFSTDKQAAE